MDMRRHGQVVLFGFGLVGLAVIAICCICGAAQRDAAADPNGGGEIRLIVFGDDISCCHAANIACIKSYQDGIMRTVEIMVPCPWFEEAAKLLNANPGIDVGVHLTLTSEWEGCKWRPLTCGKSIADKDGYLHQMTREWDKWPAGTGFYDANPRPEEVEAELRAQIELALKKIKNVTHISDHMFALRSRPDLVEIAGKLAREYNIEFLADLRADNVAELKADRSGVTDRRSGYQRGEGKSRETALAEALEKVGPGTWVYVEHPGLDTPEMEAMGHRGYETVAKDREDVTKAYTSQKVKEIVKKRNIEVISYGDLLREGKAK